MQIANEMDMEDCRSLSKWMEAVDGDIIGSDVLDGQEASKQDMQDHEYLAEQYEKKSASDDIFMKVYYESEKYYYKKLVKNDEEIYNEWKAIEQNYDEIDQMSAYYFVRGNEIRSTIELALQKLKQLSIDNSQECMSDTYRNILSEIYIMYYNTFDEGYLSETDKHQIKCWLKTDYKLRELELEHAKEIIDNYLEENELAKELIKSGMPGEAAIIIPQMSVEEFNEYQMIVALVNKISKWNGFVLGAIDAVPFATEAIDWCDRIAIEGVGKQIVEDATLSNTMENVKLQNPIAYGSGYAASVIAQINILRGLKGGEAVESAEFDIPNTKSSVSQKKDPFRNAYFKKADIKMVNDAANQVCIDRKDFGNYIHEIKADLGMKANQNFTYKELLELAEEYKKMKE